MGRADDLLNPGQKCGSVVTGFPLSLTGMRDSCNYSISFVLWFKYIALSSVCFHDSHAHWNVISPLPMCNHRTALHYLWRCRNGVDAFTMTLSLLPVHPLCGGGVSVGLVRERSSGQATFQCAWWPLWRWTGERAIYFTHVMKLIGKLCGYVIPSYQCANLTTSWFK